ncbi:MAG TPA: hypothetical protein VFQ79_20990 [Bryobacteraceae bacterium]|nr:hypothetical protein [Bryobacteraceae bacterium]
MAIKERLELSARILASIDGRRNHKGDHSIFSSVERQVIDRELKELAEEWALNPDSPAVPGIWRLR